MLPPRGDREQRLKLELDLEYHARESGDHSTLPPTASVLGSVSETKDLCDCSGGLK